MQATKKIEGRPQKPDEWALWLEAVIQKLRTDLYAVCVERDALRAELKIVSSELNAVRASKAVLTPSNQNMNNTPSLFEWLTCS